MGVDKKNQKGLYSPTNWCSPHHMWADAVQTLYHLDFHKIGGDTLIHDVNKGKLYVVLWQFLNVKSKICG